MMKGNLIIKNAAELVTCSGFRAKHGKEMSNLGIIPDGALVVEEGIIAKVGKTGEVMDGLDIARYDMIDASGKAVLPGFVDSHTHFVFGGYRAEEFCRRLQGVTYMEIMAQGGGIVSTVEATRNATKGDLVSLGRKRLDRMLAFGVTTVEGKSGYGLDYVTEMKQLSVMRDLDALHPVDVVSTFLGAHALPPAYEGRGERFIEYLIQEVLPDVVRGKFADFCDVFCEKGVFSLDQSRRLLESARSFGLQLKIHADEITPLGGAELACELGAVSADHLLHASETGIRKMAEAGVVATLLPGTAFSLKEPYARARFMIDSGCAVALATDFNPGSCFSESIPLLFSLATIHMEMSPEEAVTALTINGAAAVGRENKVGSLDVGKMGDAVILEFPSYRYIPYHLGVNSVETVIKKGCIAVDGRKKTGEVPC